MVKQHRYPSLTSQPAVSPLKIILTILVVLFLGFFIYGSRQIFNELRAISEGQKILILKLTANTPAREKVIETAPTGESGDYVSKVEFIKLRNESQKAISDLARELRLVQRKLRIKRTVLDKY